MLRIFLVFLVFQVFVFGADTVIPTMNFELNAPKTPEQLVSSLNVLVLLTLLFLAPSMVLVMTTFTRFVIVFGFLRQALGTQQVPPNSTFSNASYDFDIFCYGACWNKSL